MFHRDYRKDHFVNVIHRDNYNLQPLLEYIPCSFTRYLLFLVVYLLLLVLVRDSFLEKEKKIYILLTIVDIENNWISEKVKKKKKKRKIMWVASIVPSFQIQTQAWCQAQYKCLKQNYKNPIFLNILIIFILSRLLVTNRN